MSVSIICTHGHLLKFPKAAALLASHCVFSENPTLAWLVKPRYLGNAWAAAKKYNVGFYLCTHGHLFKYPKEPPLCLPTVVGLVKTYSCLACETAVSR